MDKKQDDNDKVFDHRHEGSPDDIRDLLEKILRHGPPPRIGGVDIIAGSGKDNLRRLLEEIMSGKIKASVHVLGDLGFATSSTKEMINKINDCLPCLEEVFAKLHHTRKEDKIAHAGYMSLKILLECMTMDLKNNNEDTCNMLVVTLKKFCELTGLDRKENFEKGVHTVRTRKNS